MTETLIPQNEPQLELKKIHLCLKCTGSFLCYLELWRKTLTIVWNSSLTHTEIIFVDLPIYLFIPSFSQKGFMVDYVNIFNIKVDKIGFKISR